MRNVIFNNLFKNLYFYVYICSFWKCDLVQTLTELSMCPCIGCAPGQTCWKMLTIITYLHRHICKLLVEKGVPFNGLIQSLAGPTAHHVTNCSRSAALHTRSIIIHITKQDMHSLQLVYRASGYCIRLSHMNKPIRMLYRRVDSSVSFCMYMRNTGTSVHCYEHRITDTLVAYSQARS